MPYMCVCVCVCVVTVVVAVVVVIAAVLAVVVVRLVQLRSVNHLIIIIIIRSSTVTYHYRLTVSKRYSQQILRNTDQQFDLFSSQKSQLKSVKTKVNVTVYCIL